jgi:acetyl-CoA synthetase
MLKQRASLKETRAHFAWDIPSCYNIRVGICDKHAVATPDRIAIIVVADDGTVTSHSFDDLRDLSNQLAHVLSETADPADRIAVFLPQCVETATDDVAITKMGSISLPLFTLFRPEALLHRLRDTNASVVITNAHGANVLAELAANLPALRCILCIDGPKRNADCFHAACAAQPATFIPVDTAADDPTILIYTSGTTGAPKGALHCHRVLLGHLPGVEMNHDFFPQKGDKIWTPADNVWIGGLLDVLMPALHTVWLSSPAVLANSPPKLPLI